MNFSNWITTDIKRQKAANQDCMQPTTMLLTSSYIVAHCTLKCLHRLQYTYSRDEK